MGVSLDTFVEIWKPLARTLVVGMACLVWVGGCVTFSFTIQCNPRRRVERREPRRNCFLWQPIRDVRTVEGWDADWRWWTYSYNSAIISQLSPLNWHSLVRFYEISAICQPSYAYWCCNWRFWLVLIVSGIFSSTKKNMFENFENNCGSKAFV